MPTAAPRPPPSATRRRCEPSSPGRAGRRARRPRTTTSRLALADRRRWRSASILGLGFLLLLVAFQAPLIAAIGVLANLLSTGRRLRCRQADLPGRHLSGLLGFESQGFLDAWGPIFFFAMIFAIAMDYTVFLLSSAREHWEETGDAKAAMVGGLAHSGRSILAAGAVMVAVFFTFALSGPLPPKEMGVILGVAVLLDTFLGPPAAAAGVPAARRSGGLVDALLAQPHPARCSLRARD
jgi:hypothetical protein